MQDVAVLIKKSEKISGSFIEDGQIKRKCEDCDCSIVVNRVTKKICETCKHKRNASKNKEKISQRMKEYHIKNKEKLNERSREYHAQHQAEAAANTKAYREKNKDLIRENAKKWYSNNREDQVIKKRLDYVNRSDHHKLMKRQERASWSQDRRDANNKYRRERYHIDKENVQFKLKHRLRSRLWHAVHDQHCIKSGTTFELTGCTIDELKSHLEYQFEEGMTWDNMGQWHIEHTIPCADHDLSDPDEQKKCFHFRNLTPMWGYENLSKGSLIDEDDALAPAFYWLFADA